MLSLTHFCFLFSLSMAHFSGWWFDACGPSNLNGMFYTAGQNHGKLNGIKWHYFKGPSYSLRSTTMMIRPLDFWKHHARIRNLQRTMGMLPEEKFSWKLQKQTALSPFQQQVVLWCHQGSWLWIWSLLSSRKSPLGSLGSSESFPENATHCHALKREETAQLAALQSATGSYFEPITPWW